MRDLIIYTDGGCKPNPGPGGWGAVVLSAAGSQSTPVAELSGHAEETTNNRMELTAAVEALRSLSEPARVTLVTDSTYVKNGITRWLEGWEARGWKTQGGAPVQNQDLWRALKTQISGHTVTWSWVKGHSGDRWNERADELATRGRDGGGGAPTEVPEPRDDAGRVRATLAIAWSGKGPRGAWAAELAFNGKDRLVDGRVDGESANRIHLRAALGALAALTRAAPVTVVTPASYLRDGVSWMPGWKRRDWRTRTGPVSHRDLWQALDRAIEPLDVRFELETKGEASAASRRAKRRAQELLEAPSPGTGAGSEPA